MIALTRAIYKLSSVRSVAFIALQCVLFVMPWVSWWLCWKKEKQVKLKGDLLWISLFPESSRHLFIQHLWTLFTKCFTTHDIKTWQQKNQLRFNCFLREDQIQRAQHQKIQRLESTSPKALSSLVLSLVWCTARRSWSQDFGYVSSQMHAEFKRILVKLLAKRSEWFIK